MFVLLHTLKALQGKNLPTIYDRPERAEESVFKRVPVRIPQFIAK